jgi:uncharacterized repeat protein (TIGR03803 family)
MRFPALRSLGAWLVLGVVLFPSNARGQTFQPLHAFEAAAQEPRGRLLEIADGVFLGTTVFGGMFERGTVYVLFRRADATWGTFVVHSFFGPEGSYPFAGLIRASDGNYYGTTTSGGPHGAGSVFRMSPSGRVTMLHGFAEMLTGNGGPQAPLVEAPDGSLWGSTRYGGPVNSGTIFRLTPSGGFTTMHQFTAKDGGEPAGLVLGPDGNFYGTTRSGGTHDLSGGTAFRITPAGALTTLHNFVNHPGQLIAGSDGHFYGATESGSFNDWVYRLTMAGALTILHEFDAFDQTGLRQPVGVLARAADGTLFGTVRNSGGEAGLSVGAVFRLLPDGTYQPLGALGGTLGVFPVAGLTMGRDGFVYGTAAFSRLAQPISAMGAGTAFRLAPNGPPALLAPINSGAPSKPSGRLVEGAAGNLYGTSCAGGAYNVGAIFRLDPSNVVTVVHSFDGSDGRCPKGLTLGPDGALYGTSVGGSTQATLFRMTTTGTFTTLWQRDPAGTIGPPGPPLFGPDGSIYVPMTGAGTGFGAVVRIAPDGTAAQFGAPGLLTGPLALANDGNLYGTMSENPAVYRMTPGGAFTLLHAFDYSGAWAYGVMQGSDGKLYGVAFGGGAAGVGFVFSGTLAGEAAILHEFSVTDGALPQTGLLETDPGRFVGVTTGHADFRAGLFGTVFAIDAGGALTTLHRFSWIDGALPYAGVTRASDGAVYGTTYAGGWMGGGGVIYRLIQ